VNSVSATKTGRAPRDEGRELTDDHRSCGRRHGLPVGEQPTAVSCSAAVVADVTTLIRRPIPTKLRQMRIVRNAASLGRHRLGDDRGQVLVLATVALLPMLACASLAIDVAGWWTKKTQAHLAADAGALAGAYSLPGGAASGTCPTNPSPTDAVGAACYYALQNYPGATVTVSIPPVSGPSAGIRRRSR
jgi:Putative Flp pilus-assembly TadE/G-like